MKTIRASELNAYLYCQRAWWYQISGAESENTAEMLMGQAWQPFCSWRR
jgi:CRISPR/Cas system-associated exonuclease Cas4 (RecB family)